MAGVRIEPGWTMQTLMPRGCSSMRSASLNDSKAALLAQERAAEGYGDLGADRADVDDASGTAAQVKAGKPGSPRAGRKL